MVLNLSPSRPATWRGVQQLHREGGEENRVSATYPYFSAAAGHGDDGVRLPAVLDIDPAPPDGSQTGSSEVLNSLSQTLVVLERALVAVGLMASAAGMLCMFAFGVGWVPSSSFLGIWLGTVACVSPLSVWTYRALKPLFHVPGLQR